ncbi:MAG: hypothetical protein ACRELS_11660 [Candidatus Rokuibacteriota bacterium]
MRVRVALVLLALAPAVTGAADAIGPTDIARVDEIIDAPRALFGRTRAEIERRLGAPVATEARSLPRHTHPDLRDRVEDLAYAGVTLGVIAGAAGGSSPTGGSSPLRRVLVTGDGVPLPRALTVGAERRRVEQVLGEPQELTQARYLYLYADGFPDTVEFFFRGDRVYRIEWNYSVQ